MVAYHEGLLPIKSRGKLITWSCKWSCKITWQTKIIITPLPEWLWSPNLVGWWLTLSTLIVRPLAHMVLLDHMTNSNNYLSTTTVSMATELGMLVRYLEGLLLLLSPHPLNMLCNLITWQTKIISLLQHDIPWKASTHKDTWSLSHMA